MRTFLDQLNTALSSLDRAEADELRHLTRAINDLLVAHFDEPYVYTLYDVEDINATSTTSSDTPSPDDARSITPQSENEYMDSSIDTLPIFSDSLSLVSADSLDAPPHSQQSAATGLSHDSDTDIDMTTCTAANFDSSSNRSSLFHSPDNLSIIDEGRCDTDDILNGNDHDRPNSLLNIDADSDYDSDNIMVTTIHR